MRRPWLIGILFGLCLAVVFTAMAWVSAQAIRLDREEARARRQLALEEDVRLALGRMDTMLAPLILQENARPYFLYRSFYSPQRAYTEMYAPIEFAKIRVPSPLLTYRSPYIRLHFQIDPSGEITSPQVPQGNMRDVAESQFASHETIAAADALFAQLKRAITRDALLAALPSDLTPMQKLERQLSLMQAKRTPASDPDPARQSPLQDPEQAPGQANAAPNGGGKYTSRLGTLTQADNEARNTAQAVYADQQIQQKATLNKALDPLSDVTEGVMRPVWIGDQLVLGRRVTINGKDYIQGCWVNWEFMRDWLARSVKDIFPDAHIEPIAFVEDSPKPRMLAALPAKLIVPAIDLDDGDGISTMQVVLIGAWVCMLLAAAAVGSLLVGAVALSERRGAFVSAVTHELRTPLTTFRMYAEMLEQGMVREEATKQEYLTTMRVESDRLSHLVENVLAYARLERVSPSNRAVDIPVERLLTRVSDRMSQRAQQANMEVNVQLNGAAGEVVHADPGAVDQILFNLVDNACKYAASAKDRRIHVDAGRDNGHVRIQVRDHGPGINPVEGRRLFQPFRKSAKDAAHSAPGVGLGLALSRRLAQAMGGSLKLLEQDDGACFELRLPVTKEPRTQ